MTVRWVDIALSFSERLVQLGVVAGATDSACGYAAVTRMDARADVLTVAHGAGLSSSPRRTAAVAINARRAVVSHGR